MSRELEQAEGERAGRRGGQALGGSLQCVVQAKGLSKIAAGTGRDQGEVRAGERRPVRGQVALTDLVQGAIATHHAQAFDAICSRLVNEAAGVSRTLGFDELGLDSAVLQQLLQRGEAPLRAAAAGTRVADHT